MALRTLLGGGGGGGGGGGAQGQYALSCSTGGMQWGRRGRQTQNQEPEASCHRRMHSTPLAHGACDTLALTYKGREPCSTSPRDQAHTP